jgi:hydrogenase maturation protein HypF
MELELAGWVVNDVGGVRIEVEGPRARLERFARRLRDTPPRQARIQEMVEAWAEALGHDRFEIRESDGRGLPRAAILPDLATCPDCIEDIRSRGDRREGYAFTNCTECGPRFSIVRRLPYDRPNTTMAGFVQCAPCRTEYTTPSDRRFHAQPNACPACGPRLRWWADDGTPGTTDADCIDAAAAALRDRAVVAVQGLGGFHLMADAGSDAAVSRLRTRKGREAKPLAVMVRDLAEADTLAILDDDARRLLASSAAPIVLLPRRIGAPLAPSVAPDSPWVGLMLAYTPLHHLLLEAFGGPVVATSGNRSEEPICIRPEEARARLAGIADAFLVHDRPIQRHVDDSVVRIGPEGPQILRRARGYAPLPLPLPWATEATLAVGGHLKNTVAVARDGQVWISQHIGDLETEEARRAFRVTVRDFLDLYRVDPAVVAHDLHPDYASTIWARETFAHVRPLVGVQHHHAHLAALLAEHGLEPDRRGLGVIWDGTGYGADGTVWGGEFLSGSMAGSVRLGHLRTFRLPGGEAAVREPRRSALGLLSEVGLTDHPGAAPVLEAFTPEERRVLDRTLERDLNAPTTSSAGRLFDALSALLGLCYRSRFEGEAAVRLEHAVDPGETGSHRPSLVRDDGDRWVLDWEPLVRGVLEDRVRGVPPGVSAARIHNGLVDGIGAVAAVAGLEYVALSGGCFMNARLTARTRDRLRRAGHRVLLHREVPPGDGGIALGQVATVAARRLVPGPAPLAPLRPTGV